MPIASTLQADFSQYVAETEKANAAMRSMQGEADKTSGSLGGVAGSMDKMESPAAGATGSTLKLAKGFGVAETALTAFGVQGVSQISSLGQLATAAGAAAGTIGVLGTAVLTLGAAFSGWKVGRMIAEANDLDNKVADLASSFMGWGSASKETAGYQQDLIDRAKQLTGATYDAATAAKIVADAQKDHSAQLLNNSNLVKSWQEDLRGARGGLSNLRKELEAGNLTHDQLKAKYDVSAEAVQYLSRTMQQEKTARRELETAAKAQGDAMREVIDAGKSEDEILASLTASERAAAEAALAAGVAQGTVAKAYGLSAAQVRILATDIKDAEKAAKDFDAAQKIADSANAQWNSEIVARSGTTTAKLQDDIEQWRTKQIEALDATGQATEAMYNSIEQVANEKLSQVRLEWDTLKAGAIATYADQAARAEATYQEMLTHSRTYTAGAIAEALKVRDATLRTFEEMSGAHGAAYTEFLKRDQAYTAALTKHRTEAANAGQVAYDAEAKALDEAIAYSQTYAVTIDDAKRALGQMGDEGKNAGDKTKQGVDSAKEAIIQMGGAVTQTAAQMQTLARVYDQMAQRNIEGGSALGTQIGMNYEESARQLRAKAGRAAQYEEGVNPSTWGTRGGMTSTTTNLNVNVNNGSAGNIANALVTEMRHSGVRFG